MKVLILCTGNSCRSQMAHGFLQSFDKSLEVYSGGTEPAAQVNTKAVEVMKEAGIDISSHVPTHVNTYLDQEWDYVITVCGGANESCVLPLQERLVNVCTSALTILHMLQARRSSSIRSSAVYVTKSEMPLPVSTSQKSERKNCRSALVAVTAKK